MANHRPVILGYDAVSPLGTDFPAQWDRAVAGDSGVGPLTRFPLRDKFPVAIAGEVPPFDETPYPFLKPREMAHWTSPVFKHGMLVVHRTLAKLAIEIDEALGARTALTFSTAVGGLDAVIDADRELVERGRLPNPFMNPNSCINMPTGKVSILTGITGPIATTITACATGSTSMLVGALFLESGMADIAVCGAVDFPLVEPIVAGFATMNGAYKTIKDGPGDTPEKASRPFSAGRRGFIVSEGAACVVIATRKFAAAHGFDPKLELAGWATTSDANHFVAPNRTTVARCMSEAIRHAGIRPGDVDAVNAHATSTKVGDQVEADSLHDVFGGSVPPVSANKSQIGHAMGASSAIESVFAMQGMLDGTVLPTINHDPDPEIDLDLVADKARSLDQEFVLKNAFGFGGCNTCLVLRRIG